LPVVFVQDEVVRAIGLEGWVVDAEREVGEGEGDVAAAFDVAGSEGEEEVAFLHGFDGDADLDELTPCCRKESVNTVQWRKRKRWEDGLGELFER
jgi:hypothetical protein